MLISFLVPASLAVSQCDPSPYQNPHTGGWSGWGREYAITAGKPYAAIFHWKSEKKLPDGTLQIYEGDFKQARDSSGREFKDVTSGGIVDGKLKTVVSVHIFDPVCGLLIEWRTDSPAAKVTLLIPSPPIPAPRQGSWSRPDYPAAPYTQVRNGVETRIEPLGTKDILGLEALGIRYSTFLPAGSPSENKEPVHVLIERWDSPELEITVEHLMDDARTSAGHTFEQLTHLDRSEPGPNLFRIPAGYTIEKHYAPASENGPEVVPGWK
jgi:hypothetical protein